MKILMSLVLSVFFIGGQAVAEESACEGQFGAAYGLCNAYCEAMDCDSEYAEASDVACEKVYNNYVKITGQVPPCQIGYCEADGEPCQSDGDCALLPGTCPGFISGGVSYGYEDCNVPSDCHFGWCTTSDNACTNDTNCLYHTPGSCVWTCPAGPSNNCIL